MKPKNELTREQSRALLAAKLGASAAGVALAQAVGFPLPVSACCGAAMRVAGDGATHWHECGECGKPTDAAQPEPASAPGPSPVAANRRRSAASKRGAAARAATAKAQAEHKAEAVRARIAGAVCCGVWTREHAFAAECKPPRKWRFDFACVTRKVALEVEGGIFMRSGGGHRSVTGSLRDIEKYNAATALGWRIIRCQPGRETAAETINLLSRAVTANLSLP